MHGRSVLVGALLCSVATCASAATYQRQPGINPDHYVFHVEVADNTHDIKGETDATIRFKDAGVDRVAFDLEAKKADGTGMTVSSVTEGASDTPLHFTHENDRLTVLLGHAAKVGDVAILHITYGGAPSDGLRFGTTDAGQHAIFSWNWPTKMRDWAPTLDHISSKVTTEFVVTAPEQYSVAANGVLESEVSLGDGRKVTHWNQGVPITPWLNAIGIARFQTFYSGSERGVPLVIWVPEGEKADIEHGFETARRVIDFFGDTIGPFPFEKLGQVAAPFDRSSTEHASVIFYGDGGTRDGAQPVPPRPNRPESFSRAPLLAHEMAHQWFGDSVTEATWGDVWLSEGFATYFADLYTEHYDGRDAFVASLKKERDGALAAERKVRDPVSMPADEASGPHLTQVQYAKGGWVLHMLRQQLGSPVFFKAIKVYYGRYKGGTATTDDLRRTMEEVSGQDLRWFFDQWVHRVDSPKLDISWTYDATAQAVHVSITQSQPGDAYRLPIEFGLVDTPRGDVHVQRVDMDKKQQDFTIPAAHAPVEFLFDPDTKLLADVTLTQH